MENLRECEMDYGYEAEDYEEYSNQDEATMVIIESRGRGSIVKFNGLPNKKIREKLQRLGYRYIHKSDTWISDRAKKVYMVKFFERDTNMRVITSEV